MKEDVIDNRITFRLPLQLIDEFNKQCDSHNFSKSKVLRSLVDAWLEQQREKVSV